MYVEINNLCRKFYKKNQNFKIHVGYELKYHKDSACYFGVKSSKLLCMWKLIICVENSTKKIKNFKIHVGYELKYHKVSARYFGVKSWKL